ncbi:hypothetical protein JQ604_25880 [Bradyrhizobium jicamae]|uniref:hypothetical protein n=1 Tax=Bradyrhizobium jicamae TaxID=280332 RepID=UPI001BA46859|nr:hypothetical protein [Bradyrhizobium jicamae]MBR0755623.1 hypothetical protein [Bradyrhizobium jicamae]
MPPLRCWGISITSEEYRRKAKEAEAMAEAAQDQIAKQTLLEVAKRWHRLADETEKIG